MTYPLEGIRVIDLAQMFAGPGVSMYLGDQGADVIKVEPRERGDVSRGFETTPFLAENSRAHMVLNRNKQGITLDIKTPEGKQILFKLVERSDVIIESFRPGVADRLGIGYDVLNDINPRIIYGSITGYGSNGPYAQRPGYDRILQGLSGAMVRRTAEGAPMTAGIWIADCSVPMLMAYGIMLALWMRERTGQGQKVDTSLLQAAVAMQSVNLVRAEDDPTAHQSTAIPGYLHYRCGDGVYINVAAIWDPHFARLLKLLDLEHLLDDPRIADPFLRDEFRDEVTPIFEEVFKTKTSAQWLELFHKADIAGGPVLERSQVFFEPQIIENNMMVSIAHPKAGRTRMFETPITLSAAAKRIHRPAPLLGEHTEKVLAEIGYSSSAIEELKINNVI